MIFAAGHGTRLGALTRERPKALVEVAGRPLLEHVAERLKAAGVRRLIINACPFAERIKDFVLRRRGFGLEVCFSLETPTPLETGGGLKAARHLFARTGPILLHNVDVLGDVDLAALVAAHRASGALATLHVAERPSRRQLLFDPRGLRGRVDLDAGRRLEVRPPQGETHALAFQGIHVIQAGLLDALEESGTFSILEPYLRLAASGQVIRPYLAPGASWFDVGRPESILKAERWLRSVNGEPRG